MGLDGNFTTVFNNDTFWSIHRLARVGVSKGVTCEDGDVEQGQKKSANVPHLKVYNMPCNIQRFLKVGKNYMSQIKKERYLSYFCSIHRLWVH